MSHSVMRLHLTFVLLLLGFVCMITVAVAAFGFIAPLARAQDGRSSAPRSILNGSGDVVHLQLLDAFLGAPIANADIAVESDNGIRCVRTPCPTNAKRWVGHSDDVGRLAVPRSVLQIVTYIGTEHHQSASLRDAVPGASDTWVIELFPKRLQDEGKAGTRGYKLTDARTGKPLVNVAVRLEFTQPGTLDTKTNSLGYVFFPWERTWGSLEAEAWVTADGYRRTKLDFDAHRRATKLMRR
jgi:hypothetical protein